MSLEKALFYIAGETPDIYQDVVVRDDYRLAALRVEPLSFLDIGASRGLYSLAARQRFPRAAILAVEANPTNYDELARHAAPRRIRCLRAALAPKSGELFERIGENSSVHSYHAPSRWKSIEVLRAEGYQPSAIPTITLAEAAGALPAERLVIKIDVEAAEWHLVDDPEAEAVFRGALQVGMELHYACHERAGVTREQFVAWAAQFSPTHEVEITPLAEWAGILHLMRKE